MKCHTCINDVKDDSSHVKKREKAKAIVIF